MKPSIMLKDIDPVHRDMVFFITSTTEQKDITINEYTFMLIAKGTFSKSKHGDKTKDQKLLFDVIEKCGIKDPETWLINEINSFEFSRAGKAIFDKQTKTETKD